MASTTFVDNQTVIYAAWLNDVNNAVYNGIFPNGSLSLTTLSVSGTVTGAGFTAGTNATLLAPGAIGTTTPNVGYFTTLRSNGSNVLTTSNAGTGTGASGTWPISITGSAARLAPSSNLVTPGYQNFGTGNVIIQYGTTGAIAGGASANIYFAQVFPNAIFVVLVTPIENPVSTGGGGVQSQAANGFTITNLNASTAQQFNYIAIGY